MKRILVLVFALVVALAGTLPAQGQAAPPKPGAPQAQTPPPQQPPAQQPPAAQKPPAPRSTTRAVSRVSVMLFITDRTGAPVPGAQVTLEGPTPREGATSREGTLRLQGLRPGDYRLLLEAEGFVTLEKELTLRSAAGEIEISLTRAATPPKPPDPTPASPARPSHSDAATPPAPDPNATIEVVSVVDWLAKNRLERGQPRKEGVVAKATGESAALLQVREAVRDRSHIDADEVIYVINGSATLSSKGRVQQIETGTLILIPRGVTFTIENRGREPLWALSVLSLWAVQKP